MEYQGQGESEIPEDDDEDDEISVEVYREAKRMRVDHEAAAAEIAASLQSQQNWKVTPSGSQRRNQGTRHGRKAPSPAGALAAAQRASANSAALMRPPTFAYKATDTTGVGGGPAADAMEQ